MESCKYHPDTAPNFTCSQCEIDLCKECVDHSIAGEARCFHCGSPLTIRVTASSMESLARRLPKAFRYPMTADAMMFIFGLSVATTFLAVFPLGGFIKFLAMLFCTGLAVNYSFLCLKATAAGDMTPPRLQEAAGGSLSILIRLFAIIFITGIFLNFVASSVSSALAITITLVLVIGIPAMLMCLAMSDSITEAINPVNFIGLMLKTGIPYLILVGFLFIMVSSVSLIQAVIGDDLLFLSAILQSAASSYYAMVAFHLMGYLLYQHQDALGYVSEDAESTLLYHAELEAVTHAHVSICLKEGDYDQAKALLQSAIKQSPTIPALWQRYFDLLCQLEDRQALMDMADKHLSLLLKLDQGIPMLRNYRRLVRILPEYVPGTPALRLSLARLSLEGGDAKAAVRLLNGLHKAFPEYDRLVESGVLLKTALEALPNMEAQVEKCQSLIDQLRIRYPEQVTEGQV